MIPTPLRPLHAGDALELADLALARGDAFDAAVQYRAVLADSPGSPDPYVAFQLARAYLAQGQTEQVEPLLRIAVDAETSASWPAVLELATLLMRDPRRDPLEVFRALSGRAGSRRRELQRFLVNLAAGERAAQLVALMASEARDDSCSDQLAVFELDRPGSLPGWRICPDPVRAVGPHDATDEQLLRIGHIARRWAVWVPGTRGSLPAFWVHLARDASRLIVEGPATPATEIASWLALAACYNASVADESGDWDFELPQNVREEILAGMRPEHRALAEPLLDRFPVDEKRLPH